MSHKRLWLLGLSMVSAVLLIALDAQAQTIEETFQEFHLLGTWAPNCNVPPIRFDAWVAYVASPDGTVTRRTILDEKGTSYSNRVLSARRVAADRLALSYEYGKNTGYILMEFRDDRHRTLEARFGDTVNIEDGIMKATGKETVWLLRCQ
jgi:hypothetical protein